MVVVVVVVVKIGRTYTLQTVNMGFWSLSMNVVR